MINALLRILLSYALAVFAATAIVLMELMTISGGAVLDPGEFLIGMAILGVFSWAGFIFAIQAERRGWTRATTFMGGGLIAMVVGVATLMSLGALQGLGQGYLLPEWKTALSFMAEAARLLALGILPGLAGGLTYWMAISYLGRASAGPT